MANDFGGLRDFFCADAVRYGPEGNQYGIAEIDAARRGSTTAVARELRQTTFEVLGPNAVLAATEFTRAASGKRGRQTQVWIRDEDSWRVLHAHVSMLDA
jgi:hypothetical protein